MATNEVKIPIPARLYNASEGGHVAGIDDIDCDKAYSPADYSGMGRKVLRKNMVNGVNTITQEMVSDTNTVYVIKYDFTLASDITIPANCVLKFDGGSFSNSNGNNYTIKGSFSIEDCIYSILNNVSFVKNETVLKVDYIRPEWYGAKGDYDYSTNSGTDDSAAFTTAIKQAVLSKVNKVKLCATSYFISNGITVTDGDIFIEGVSAELREDAKLNTLVAQDNDVVVHKASSLVASPTCSKIIYVTDHPTHPIRIENVNFLNYYINNHNYTCCGIYYDSAYHGPLWPFIIHYCYFFGFDKAIYFTYSDKNSRYNVYKVDIQWCAFNKNNWCVMFYDLKKDNWIDADNNFCYCWNFTFSNNCAHDNTHNLYIIAAVGQCIVYNNNFEGDIITNIDGTQMTEDYKNLIILFNDTNLEFNSNHFEAVKVRFLKIVMRYNEDRTNITVKNNITNVNTTTENGTLLIITTSTYNKYITIKDIDCPIRIGDLICLMFDCDVKTPIYPTGRNFIYYNDLYATGGNFPFTMSDTLTNNIIGGSSYAFNNGKLHNKLINQSSFKTYNSYDCSYDYNYIVLYYSSEILLSVDNKDIIAVTDNKNVTVGGTIKSRKGYRKIALICRVPKNASSENKLILYKFNTESEYIHSAAIFLLNSSEELSSNILLSKISDAPNVIASTSDLTNITEGLVDGCHLFCKSNNKELIYNGSSWVDSTGTPV